MLRLDRKKGRRPRQEYKRKLMMFRGQRQRLTPRSESRRRPKEKRKRVQKVRKGPRLRMR